MIKPVLFSLIFFLSLQVSFSQRVEVPTDKKEIEEILKKAREETQASKLYYDEDKKCRNLRNAGNFTEAEVSCKRLISLAENLPKDRYMERKSAYELLAVVLLWQRRAEEAVPLLNKSLEVAKPVLDDTDAETGEIYFFLGQANHQLGNIDAAKEFYNKAENTYRTAFKDMGDSNIRAFYTRPIINILEAHLILLKGAGLKEEAAKVEKRLAETKIEFAQFLEK